MHGFLNLNKPAGITSHDCVAQVRRILHLKKVGHGGTLDPAATGVLPIAIGKATRLLRFLSHEKAYLATIRFGLTTTTDDLEGEILSQSNGSELVLDSIKPILPQFMGTIQQIPPNFSAIQVGGKRLHQLARAGEPIEAPPRTVVVYNMQILDWRTGILPELDLAIDCGTGTYIRSIARDLGEKVGTGATLAKLQRTRSSDFKLTQSLTLEDFAAQVVAEQFQPMAVSTALAHLPLVQLSEEETKRWNHGQRIAIDPAFHPESVDNYLRVCQSNGDFLGIGQIRDQAFLLPTLVWGAERS